MFHSWQKDSLNSRPAHCVASRTVNLKLSGRMQQMCPAGDGLRDVHKRVPARTKHRNEIKGEQAGPWLLQYIGVKYDWRDVYR